MPFNLKISCGLKGPSEIISPLLTLSPSKTFNANPYDTTSSLGTSYSASSTVLNVDINSLDDEAKDHNILLKTEQNDKIENILSNSFGFGGTNATLLMSRYYD